MSPKVFDSGAPLSLQCRAAGVTPRQGELSRFIAFQSLSQRAQYYVADNGFMSVVIVVISIMPEQYSFRGQRFFVEDTTQ